jgi:hypothetical protein
MAMDISSKPRRKVMNEIDQFLKYRIDETPITAEGVRDVLLEAFAYTLGALPAAIDDPARTPFPGVPVDIVRCGLRHAFAEAFERGPSSADAPMEEIPLQ